MALGYGDGTFQRNWNYELGAGLFFGRPVEVFEVQLSRPVNSMAMAFKISRLPPSSAAQSRCCWVMAMDHFSGHSIS